MREFPKFDSETWSKQIMLGKWHGQTCLMQGCYKLSICQKNTVSEKYNEAKYNKIKYAYNTFKKWNLYNKLLPIK